MSTRPANCFEDATSVIRRYFEKRGPTIHVPVVGGSRRYVVLQFGERQVIVYGAFHPFSSQPLMAVVHEAVREDASIVWDVEPPTAVVVVFSNDPRAREMQPLDDSRRDLAAVVVPLSS